MLARMLMDVIAGLTALLVPPTVAVTALTVLGQGETSLTTEGIGGLAGAGATAALFGWYLYYQNAVADPRRELERARQQEATEVRYAAERKAAEERQAQLIAQMQRDYATMLVAMQDAAKHDRENQQREADTLLQALLKQHSHVCPLGPASPASCPLRTPSGKVHREPPSAEGDH